MADRFLLRLPQDLRNALQREAERQGVSLNALLITLLAGAIGWQPDPGEHDAGHH